MKKIFLSTVCILLVLFISVIVINFKKTNDNDNPIKKENFTNDLMPETNNYLDTNPIEIGLYKYYGSAKNRELISEYSNSWTYHTDISSFEVFFINNNSISGNNFQDTFKEYYDKYTNIENYRIGYKISFITKTSEVNKTILSPKDTEDFFDYLEIYLYDDYHREKGVWYSHTTEEEFNENTLLTSIKLTAGKLIHEIISDITVTAFTYDSDDFDNEGNYRGNSKYTIIVKNPNN